MFEGERPTEARDEYSAINQDLTSSGKDKFHFPIFRPIIALLIWCAIDTGIKYSKPKPVIPPINPNIPTSMIK